MTKININGIELYYELHGPEEGELLVLNNGVIMNAATSWAFQTAALSRCYRLLQYDCRGQGQSDHPEEAYSMAQHAEDLVLSDLLGVGHGDLGGLGVGHGTAPGEVMDRGRRITPLLATR